MIDVFDVELFGILGLKVDEIVCVQIFHFNIIWSMSIGGFLISRAVDNPRFTTEPGHQDHIDPLC